MFVIGLIDDEEPEQRKIRRTIKTIANNGVEFDFKTYAIPADKKTAIDELTAEVLSDISDKKITALIVDYKLMFEAFKVEGTEILKKINDEVYQFPVIVLTERVEDSVKAEYVDADKVYAKRKFFKLEDEYSIQKVSNIFDSMRKYVQQRDRLLLSLEELKRKLSNGDRSVIPSILIKEGQLRQFIPMDITMWDMAYDLNEMHQVVELLEEANKLME